MPSLNMLLLESTLKKLSPINDCEKVDLLISTMLEQRIPHTNEVELQVLYEIRKSKIQLYFKEQWQKAQSAPIVKEPSVVIEQKTVEHNDATSEPVPTKRSKTDIKALRKEIKARAREVLDPKPTMEFPIVSKPKVFSSKPPQKKKEKVKEKSTRIDPFELVARREAKNERNRDKRVQPGYSSTGVKLPTAQAMKELQEKRQHYREVYYTNKRHKDENDPKRGNGYIYIDTPM